MSVARLMGGIGLAVLACSGSSAQPTVELPRIIVRAPSPIVRPAPAPTAPGPATPAPETPLQGTLPIVTDQFATVTIVPAEEIQRSTGATLGEVLQSKPGITGSSFAPGAASRPIVRGLDNYRVRIQENGLAANDVSEIGEDHGVPVDPLGAQQVEVIRGPATLRWGSQAIGGVVNVDNNRIPTAIPRRGFAAEMKGAGTTVDNGLEGALLLDAGKGNFAFHADAYGRNASDYRIPSYPYRFPPDPAPVVRNGRQPNSAARSNGQSLGGSYLFDGGFVGVAVTQFNSLYRVPGIEATNTNTRIDMKQTKLASKGEYRPQSSGVAAIRFWLGLTDYKHHELANETGGFDGIQQTFTNKAQEGRVEVQLAPFDLRFAALATALGVQAARQDLAAPGVEGGLFDPNRTTSIAGFIFNELKFNDAQRLQAAGRIEQARVTGSSPDLFVDPTVTFQRDRRFAPKSGAIGFLQDLPWGLVGSVTAQHVERAPRAPELLSRGVHEATGTFDIGDPNLRTEIANSVEAGIRRAKGPLRFEATAYHTMFKGFIFRRLTGETCDGGNFADCTPTGAGGALNQAVFSQRDARFRGGEVQAQLDVAPLGLGMFGVDGQYDIVRATFADGTNVPRIPPQRIGGGLFWRSPEWFARIGLLHANAQNQVAAVGETPTAGYNLLKAEISHSERLRNDPTGATVLTLGVTGNNLLSEDIRNHVSFKKDEVLAPGRSFKLFANVRY